MERKELEQLDPLLDTLLIPAMDHLLQDDMLPIPAMDYYLQQDDMLLIPATDKKISEYSHYLLLL